MCWASGNGVSPSAAGLGWAWHGDARPGAAWYGPARAAMAARRAFGLSLPPSLVDKAGLGTPRPGLARTGAARRGRARVTDGGTEGFGLPCHPHKGGRGVPAHGAARLGAARQGLARSGKGCRQQHWGLRLPLLLSTEGRSGTEWLGVAGPDRARHGQTRRDTARADDLSTEGASPPCWVHSTHFKV